jgi:hypothetical protein
MSNPAATKDYGNNPKVQKILAIAARAIRTAIAEVDKAYEAASDGSDDEARCAEARSELEGALEHVEWKPPASRARKVRS